MNPSARRDGFEVVTFDGEVIHFVDCDYDSDRMRERVMLGLLRNMRDDCFVRDTRDALDPSAQTSVPASERLGPEADNHV